MRSSARIAAIAAICACITATTFTSATGSPADLHAHRAPGGGARTPAYVTNALGVAFSAADLQGLHCRVVEQGRWKCSVAVRGARYECVVSRVGKGEAYGDCWSASVGRASVADG